MRSFAWRGSNSVPIDTTAVVLTALAQASPHPDRARAMRPDSALAELDLDSLGLVEMITVLEEELRIDLSDVVGRVREAVTLAELRDAIESVRQTGGAGTDGA